MRMSQTARILTVGSVVLGGAAALHSQTPERSVPREAAFGEAVSVTGTGRVTLTPDRASFNAGVQTLAPTLAAATQENGARMTAILNALKAAGATERDLRTTGLSIYPQQAQQGEGKPLRIVGYQVSNSVTVTKDDPAVVARLVEVAVNAGANAVSGVNFTVSDPARGRDPGLQAAFADAKAKADVLAKAAGRTIGRALAITEGGAAQQMPTPMMRMRAEAAQMASVPVESGTEEITFTVSVMFELQ
jgi:uncharacterized protein YggE